MVSATLESSILGVLFVILALTLKRLEYYISV